jgi:chemotaxis methyl-accepting protein methylase
MPVELPTDDPRFAALRNKIERGRVVLLPGGFLVLGKVESLLGKSREMFEPVSSRERIYRRI